MKIANSLGYEAADVQHSYQKWGKSHKKLLSQTPDIMRNPKNYNIIEPTVVRLTPQSNHRLCQCSNSI